MFRILAKVLSCIFLLGVPLLQPAAASPQSGERFRLQGNALADQGKFDEAHRFFVRACAQEDARGCYNLALAEIRGEGTAPSCVTGHLYFSKACRLGFPNACAGLERLPRECGQPFGDNPQAQTVLCQVAGEEDCVQAPASQEETRSEDAEDEADNEALEVDAEYDSEAHAAIFKKQLKDRQEAFDRKLEQQREARREEQRREQRRQEQIDAEITRKKWEEEQDRREYDRRRQQEEDRQREYDRQRASW